MVWEQLWLQGALGNPQARNSPGLWDVLGNFRGGPAEPSGALGYLVGYRLQDQWRCQRWREQCFAKCNIKLHSSLALIATSPDVLWNVVLMICVECSGQVFATAHPTEFFTANGASVGTNSCPLQH